MEVAWQRLEDKQRSNELRRHWSRYGNLESPQFEKTPVQDDFDDYLGIHVVQLRFRNIWNEISRAAGYSVRFDGRRLGDWLDSIPRRWRFSKDKW